MCTEFMTELQGLVATSGLELGPDDELRFVAEARLRAHRQVPRMIAAVKAEAREAARGGATRLETTVAAHPVGATRAGTEYARALSAMVADMLSYEIVDVTEYLAISRDHQCVEYRLALAWPGVVGDAQAA